MVSRSINRHYQFAIRNSASHPAAPLPGPVLFYLSGGIACRNQRVVPALRARLVTFLQELFRGRLDSEAPVDGGHQQHEVRETAVIALVPSRGGGTGEAALIARPHFRPAAAGSTKRDKRFFCGL